MSYRINHPCDYAWRKTVCRNNLTNLFKYGRIKIIKARSKIIQQQAEKIITIAKKKNLASVRQIKNKIYNHKYNDKNLLFYICNSIPKKYNNRNGGYTRIIKLGIRRGDASEIVILELI